MENKTTIMEELEKMNESVWSKMSEEEFIEWTHSFCDRTLSWEEHYKLMNIMDKYYGN